MSEIQIKVKHDSFYIECLKTYFKSIFNENSIQYDLILYNLCNQKYQISNVQNNRIKMIFEKIKSYNMFISLIENEQIIQDLFIIFLKEIMASKLQQSYNMISLKLRNNYKINNKEKNIILDILQIQIEPLAKSEQSANKTEITKNIFEILEQKRKNNINKKLDFKDIQKQQNNQQEIEQNYKSNQQQINQSKSNKDLSQNQFKIQINKEQPKYSPINKENINIMNKQRIQYQTSANLSQINYKQDRQNSLKSQIQNNYASQHRPSYSPIQYTNYNACNYIKIKPKSYHINEKPIQNNYNIRQNNIIVNQVIRTKSQLIPAQKVLYLRNNTPSPMNKDLKTPKQYFMVSPKSNTQQIFYRHNGVDQVKGTFQINQNKSGYISIK